MILKIENLKDKTTSIRKGIEPKFDKNLTETINQHEGENEKLNDKIKLFETENKILKEDIATKQKLVDSLLEHNNLLITQQERLTTELLTLNSINNCKARNKDAMQTENNNRQKEIPSKPRVSRANKLPLKKNPSKVIQPIETKNRYCPLETEENPSENKSTRTDSYLVIL